jgi:sugar O-acyltransferase (sialic acid O-acetyltransferase NeuD family)
MGASGVKRIAIIGAGGHGREQLDLIAAVVAAGGAVQVEGFVVDAELAPPDGGVRGLPVLGGLEWLEAHRREVGAVCAIGGSAARFGVIERLAAYDVRFETLIHPAASVSSSARLGEGAIVCAGAVLTSDVVLGAHVHVGVGGVVSHDCVLGDFTSLAPGVRLAGAVRVGAGAWLGVGTVVRDRVAVGAWSITGAGTVVLDDLPPDTTAVGVPAHVISTRPPGWQRSQARAAEGGRRGTA